MRRRPATRSITQCCLSPSAARRCFLQMKRKACADVSQTIPAGPRSGSGAPTFCRISPAPFSIRTTAMRAWSMKRTRSCRRRRPPPFARPAQIIRIRSAKPICNCPSSIRASRNWPGKSPRATLIPMTKRGPWKATCARTTATRWTSAAPRRPIRLPIFCSKNARAIANISPRP